MYPYDQFEDIDWCVESVDGDVVFAVVLDPPLAKQSLPDRREFSLHAVQHYISS